MSTPTTPPGRVAGSRWLFLAAAGCAAVIAIVVFVVIGDGNEAEGQSAPAGSEQVEVDYDNLSVPTIPYTEVMAWSTERVKMEGELPEGTIYRSIDTNPRWVKVNRFTGEVTYEPKAKGIQFRPYDITIGAQLPDGETLNIEATVEVIPYESEDSKPDLLDPPILPRTIVSPGDSVTVPLEGPQLPEGTTYIDNVGPLWMRVDESTGEVSFILDETFSEYPEGTRNILITAWTPDGQVASIRSEVEVVAGR
ncbi:Rib/alpha-like domain-containing protein [Corynebacterium sp. SCR221107]|uniref:Rib/alpha-like domain-containing protein n=1 Tax=Corynebacterium sp. SCR221107 TaxID=3017361 RepID=UPI0022EC4C5E|nr:Rib/alpha-like domain-containing protein [Corynebacterium sp. SCR221107]WBT08247.1 Rib/alpha-like domain-containing protein [Corynebacterium sp. SCR221107]